MPNSSGTTAVSRTPGRQIRCVASSTSDGRDWIVVGTALIMAALGPRLDAVELHLGGAGNVAFANFASPDVGEFLNGKTVTRLGGGVTLDLGLTRQFSLVIRLSLVNKGTRSHFDARPDMYACWDDMYGHGACDIFVPGEPAFDFELRHDYLEVPLMAKFRFRSKGIQPYVFAGPTTAFLLSAKYVPLGVGVSSDFTDLYDTRDVTIAGGAGVAFPWRRARFFVEGEYDVGLRNILPADARARLETRAFLITVGLEFRIHE